MTMFEMKIKQQYGLNEYTRAPNHIYMLFSSQIHKQRSELWYFYSLGIPQL